MKSGLRWRRRGQGLAFLVVVALLLALTIAIYNKSLPWQSSDKVLLHAETIGNELNVPSDVKFDGVLVGRVSAVNSNGRTATLTLQLDKNEIGQIPKNVEAQILPKTLFGEKFVQLVEPPVPSGTLAAGDSISEDVTKTSLELQTVFDNLVPVLKALNPVQLKETLSAVATALQGRGEQLGQNLVLAEKFFKRFNKDLPNLNHDITALATLANNYADASPDLLAALRNFSVTASTFAAKQSTYASFLTDSQNVANDASTVLGDNSQRLINLNNISKPVTALYARNSIVLECMSNGLAIYDRDRLEGIFGPSSTKPEHPDTSSDANPNSSPPGGIPAIHIELIPVGNRGTYTRAERPTVREFRDLPDYSKRSYYKGDTQKQYEAQKSRLLCRGLPYGNHTLQPHFDKYPTYPGGATGNYSKGGLSVPATGAATGGPAKASDSSFIGTDGAGSSAEQLTLGRMLSSLAGGADQSNLGLEDLLLGPMVRGMIVRPT